MRHQIGNRRTDVDHQIGQFHERHHQIEEVSVVVKVAVAHHTHFVEVWGKDFGIFKDGAVLNDGIVGLCNGNNVFETFVEKIDLQIERPSGHVVVEVFKIRVVVNGFEERFPVVVFCQHFGERGFSATDVSGYCDVHGFE